MYSKHRIPDMVNKFRLVKLPCCIYLFCAPFNASKNMFMSSTRFNSCMPSSPDTPIYFYDSCKVDLKSLNGLSKNIFTCIKWSTK